jgi:hypothetical protein
MAKPLTALLEFLAWFTWLACFALFQNGLCARYPRIRSVCRKAYAFTMILPIVAGIWLMVRSSAGADLFAVLNRAFGAGVFAQTFLRSVVLLKWLVASGIPYHVAIPANGAATALYAEGEMVALAGVLGHSLPLQSAAPEDNPEVPRNAK